MFSLHSVSSVADTDAPGDCEGGKGCSNGWRMFQLLAYTQVHLFLPRGVTKETRQISGKNTDSPNEQQVLQMSFSLDVWGLFLGPL